MGAKERAIKHNARAARIGTVAIVLLLALTVFAVTARNGLPDYLPGVNRTIVNAAFTDVGALRPGDDVRIAGVRAGYVSAITLEHGAAVATLEIDSGRPVYDNAQASIAARSSLGQKYVELNPGTPSSPQMVKGALIPVAQTTDATEIDQVLDGFDPKTRQGLSTLLKNVGSGVGGRGDDLNAFIRTAPGTLKSLATVSQALAVDSGADLNQLLTTGRDLAGAFGDQTGQIAAVMRQTQATLSALDTDGGVPLGQTIDQGGSALASTRAALRSLDAPLGDLATASVALMPAAKALAAATPPLRGFLRDAVTPLHKVPAVATQATGAFGALSPTLVDARAVTRQLSTLMPDLAVLLAGLAPYSPEMIQFFINADSALGEGDSAGHWLRFTALANTQAGGVGLLGGRDAYPAPGQAAGERKLR